MKIKILFSLFFLIFWSVFLNWIIDSASAQGILESLEQNITGMVESIKPSLVTIEAEVFPGGKVKPSRLTSFVGSGVIYSPDGHILTTSSVVRGMKDFKVTLSNDKSYRAKLIGTDFQTNIAVLRIDTRGLRSAKFGNSDRVKEGSWITVVGNSYGLPTAVSFGIVNGIRKDKTIQMSANVSPGNSGGPVLNTRGEVIGLVSAKLSETSFIEAMKLYEDKERRTINLPPTEIEIPSSGISLAIPINLVREKANWIIKNGTNIEKGYLGVYLEDLDEETKVEINVNGGVLITGVVEGSPAEKSGLKDEDIVIGFDQGKVKDSDQFKEMIENTPPNRMVRLDIIRDGRKENLRVTLGRVGSAYSSLKGRTLIPPIKIPEINIPEIKIQYDEAKNEYNEAQAKKSEEELKRILNKSLDNFKKELERLSRELERLNQKIEKEKEGK
jgi:S1-C subfamily serine protease